MRINTSIMCKFPYYVLCVRYVISCDFCKIYNSVYFILYSTHSHEESSTNVCYHCGKTFESRKKFNYHMLRHQEIRNFQCNYCGMKFLQANHLNRHLATHSDDRPYVCTFTGCSKSFKLPDTLKKHCTKVHQMETASKVPEEFCIKIPVEFPEQATLQK